jgi:angiomotin like
MQSSERREKLERVARQRLQEENRMLRQQYELLLSQVDSPLSGVSSNSTDELLSLKREIGKRDTMLAQLMAQNKELTGCRERQEIELAAQRATLQEQRTHIEILDTALMNAQANVIRLEEECRKRQLYEERVVQLQQNLSSLQMARDKLEGEINDLRLSRRVNNAAAQTALLPGKWTNLD